MARWIQEGKIRYREDIVDGFENTPRAFIDMLGGKNTGKMLVKAKLSIRAGQLARKSLFSNLSDPDNRPDRWYRF